MSACLTGSIIERTFITAAASGSTGLAWPRQQHPSDGGSHLLYVLGDPGGLAALGRPPRLRAAAPVQARCSPASMMRSPSIPCGRCRVHEFVCRPDARSVRGSMLASSPSAARSLSRCRPCRLRLASPFFGVEGGRAARRRQHHPSSTLSYLLAVRDVPCSAAADPLA